MRSEVEDQFLAKLREHPNDDDARVVYADWLEEQSRMPESEFLRLQLKLKAMQTTDFGFQQNGRRLRELAVTLDQTWRTLVANAPIERCEARFDFVCPKKWEALAPTEKEDVRFCDACKKDVYYSKTLGDAYTNAQQGRCIVVDLVQIRFPHDIDMARPENIIPMAGAIVPPPEWNAPKPQVGIIDRLRNLFSR